MPATSIAKKSSNPSPSEKSALDPQSPEFWPKRRHRAHYDKRPAPPDNNRRHQPEQRGRRPALERADLVKRRKAGREHYLSFNAAPLDEASEWIEQTRMFWARRLDTLECVLKSDLQEKKGRKK